MRFLRANSRYFIHLLLVALSGGCFVAAYEAQRGCGGALPAMWFVWVGAGAACFALAAVLMFMTWFALLRSMLADCEPASGIPDEELEEVEGELVNADPDPVHASE